MDLTGITVDVHWGRIDWLEVKKDMVLGGVRFKGTRLHRREGECFNEFG